jgi:hypothetical protein
VLSSNVCDACQRGSRTRLFADICIFAALLLVAGAVHACLESWARRPQDPVQRLRRALHEGGEAQVNRTQRCAVLVLTGHKGILCALVLLLLLLILRCFGTGTICWRASLSRLGVFSGVGESK